MDADFKKLAGLYEEDDFSKILGYDNGLRFLKLRSMSRQSILERFCEKHSLTVPKGKDRFEFVFNEKISDKVLEGFIRDEFMSERKQIDADFLYNQLYKLDVLDWGGLYQNGLEKTVVNRYVKQIMDYDELNKKIGGELHASMSGYVRASWYNNWTTVLIEDMFNDHPDVLPAIGKVKNLDFFWHDMPLDLKVTYFPNEFMTMRRRQQGLRPELVELKRFAKEHDISYDCSDNARMNFKELYRRVEESQLSQCKEFITCLRKTRKDIIDDAIANPKNLARWLYENQGERRFDAAYRIYLILVDTDDLDSSWKLKRNRDLVPETIAKFLNGDPNDSVMDVDFDWKGKKYATKCCVLFIRK